MNDFNTLLLMAIIVAIVYWLAHAPERKLERQLNDPVRMEELDRKHRQWMAENNR